MYLQDTETLPSKHIPAVIFLQEIHHQLSVHYIFHNHLPPITIVTLYLLSLFLFQKNNHYHNTN